MHAKVFIADGERAVVGSMNLDYRSLAHNFENGIWIYNDKVILNMKQDFIDTMNKSEQIINKPKRKLISKFIYILVKIFSPLL